MLQNTTRDKLLSAAKKIINTEGYESVTVRKVADLAGYTYPILYHYFHDLNTLLWILRIKMIEEMIVELTVPYKRKLSAIEEFKHELNLYTSYFFDHPNIFRFFYFYPFKKPENNNEYEILDNKFPEIWNRSFARLTLEGYIPEKDISIIAKTIIYSLQGMIMLSLSANGSLSKNEVECELDKLITYFILKE